ncbi:MAG: DDE-type integrase/transposase/recombinase [Bacteroidetes bacterium]|nr:DDE-type integrase/transposase/recombinase [Bacteroidota bacterium]
MGRILREDILLCLRKRKFQTTTDFQHWFHVYPNLTRGVIPEHTNQLWVADITYIRLAEEFGGVAVVLDACSRLVIGWSLERTLEAKLAVNALRMAQQTGGSGRLDSSLRSRRPVCFWRLHAVAEGQRHRAQHESQRGLYDNAKAESFRKT